MNFGNQCFYKDVEMLVIIVVFGNKLSVSHISNYRYYQELSFFRWCKNLKYYHSKYNMDFINTQ